MTKMDIADSIRDVTGLPLNEAAYCVEAILEAILNTIKGTLAQGLAHSTSVRSTPG